MLEESCIHVIVAREENAMNSHRISSAIKYVEIVWSQLQPQLLQPGSNRGTAAA
jgi:hypothetical protein